VANVCNDISNSEGFGKADISGPVGGGGEGVLHFTMGS
jgi:hypothetical protein